MSGLTAFSVWVVVVIGVTAGPAVASGGVRSEVFGPATAGRWLSPGVLSAAVQDADPAAPAASADAEARDATTVTSGPDRDNRVLPRPWRAELTLRAWLTGVEGDMTAAGTPVDISASFLDILDESDSLIGLSGRFELAYHKLGVFVDATYMEVGVDDRDLSADVQNTDITYDQKIIDFGLTYRVAEWEPAGSAASSRLNGTLDLYAGGRYNEVELTVEVPGQPDSSGDRDWLDPIVGARLTLPIAKSWHIGLKGDVGGFGVESDFAWSAEALLGYDFSLGRAPTSVFIGYRAMGWDFDEGSGASEFEWDIIQHGLIFGLQVRF